MNRLDEKETRTKVVHKTLSQGYHQVKQFCSKES